MVNKFILKHKATDFKIPMVSYIYNYEYPNINIHNYIFRLNPVYIPKTIFKPFYLEQQFNVVDSSR